MANEEFKADIGKFIEKAIGQHDRFLREFVQDFALAVIKDTPVATGFLRASWYIGINNPGGRKVTTEGQRSGAQATQESLDRIGLEILGAKAGDTVYLSNNAKYAARIEFGFSGTDALGRVYNQRPRAMVRRNIARAEDIAQGVLRRITNG